MHCKIFSDEVFIPKYLLQNLIYYQNRYMKKTILILKPNCLGITKLPLTSNHSWLHALHYIPILIVSDGQYRNAEI